MVKADWGQKRTCQSCSAKFYDMNRAPILCPKCGATFDPETLQKLRRGKAVAAPKAVPADEPEPAEVEEVADAEEAAEDEEEEAVIEDTSELGQDSDDVDEVVDKADEDGEGR